VVSWILYGHVIESNFSFFISYGEGEPTDNSADFYSWIMDGRGTVADKGDQDDHMTEEEVCKGMNYFVFGLGNKTYEHFNAIARRLDKRLTKLGAVRVGERGEGDDDAR
jgi:NADPH-ferrihemoprotein reductase